jgi:thiol-disulfide isomerase/thioredoxin
MYRTLLFGLLLLAGVWLFAQNPEILDIGQEAPAFTLEGIDEKIYSLESFAHAEVLTIVFTANHCPTAQAYEDRLNELSLAYEPEDMLLVAISSNYPGAVCLEELGYSDLGDSFEEMQIRVFDKGYTYPYLYDGLEQAAALAYGAEATPHVFIFDRERKLRYSGRIDNMEDPYQKPTQLDARNAINALLEDKAVPVEITKAFGCSMKWKSKQDWKKNLDERWKEKPVELSGIDLQGIRELFGNNSEKYRLINVWATWCGPCIIEFPEFVAIQRMYGQRDFEMISLSVDNSSQEEKVKNFLLEQQAAFQNYLYLGEDQEDLINEIDPNWQGVIPYTLLVAPGGEVVHRHKGIIDALELKRVIVSELGRYYADDKK